MENPDNTYPLTLTTDRIGQINNALSFNGTDSYARTQNHYLPPELKVDGKISIFYHQKKVSKLDRETISKTHQI